MSEIEIALARAYLTASAQDPVAALIRSVKDLAKTRRLMAGGLEIAGHPARGVALPRSPTVASGGAAESRPSLPSRM